MRSKIIIVATVVASLLFVPLMASADAVQEQLRLMEQRMAEMEDRLQATSVELKTAKATVDQQQGLLTDAGLIDEDDRGIRSGVSDFVNMIDVSGVVAASYNHRLVEADNNGDLAGGSSSSGSGNALFRHRDADTFALDQFWLVMDKPVSEESRGGFHIEFVTGQTGLAQGGNNSDEPYLYSGYVSYLAPVGNGVEINVGRLATPLGAEVEQTNGNFFITQGNVFALQPVTHTGISFASEVSDGVSLIFGVVNEVYSDTFTSSSVDKAYYGQVAYSGEDFGVNVGFITGDDSTNCSVPNPAFPGITNPPATLQRSDCAITIVDVVITADPTDDISLWANFDYVNTSGGDRSANGDIFGIAVAGRLAVTETTGVSTRIEYVETDGDLLGGPGTSDMELFSLTGTVDHALTDNLMVRGEIRWDEMLEDSFRFAGGDESQVVALAEMLFAF